MRWLRNTVLSAAAAAILFYYLCPDELRTMCWSFVHTSLPAQLSMPPWPVALLCLIGVVAFGWVFQKQDLWGRVICLIGLATLIIKAVLLHPIAYVGHADASGYAEMAQSLVQRRGLEVDYVSWYFRAYEASILRPEDHWPPFYTFLIVPFFATLGHTAFAAKLPALILSSFCFPLVGYDFGKRLTRSVSVGLAIGLHMLLLPAMFRNSLRCLADVPFAFMTFLTVWLCLRGLKRPGFYLWMGMSAALAYYAKGSGMLFFPVYVLFYIAYSRWYQQTPACWTPSPWLSGRRLALVAVGVLALVLWFAPKSVHLFVPSLLLLYPLSRWLSQNDSNSGTTHPESGRWRLRISFQAQDRAFIAGMAIALLMLLPWFIRNTVHFGSPTYSTQQHASGYIGYKNWEEGTYPLYWGEDLPAFSDKLHDWERFTEKTRDYFKTHTWWVFAHAGKKWGDFQRSEKSTYVTGIAAACTLVLLWMAGMYRFLSRAVQIAFRHVSLGRHPVFFRIGAIHRWLLRLLCTWDEGRLHICWSVGAVLIVFLSVFWNPINRLQLPATALVIAIGWFGYYHLLERVIRLLELMLGRFIPRLRNRAFSAIIASVLLVGLWAPLMRHQAEASFTTWKNGAGYPFRESSQAWMETGEWISENLPGSITMTRNPWELHFYSNERAIQIPLTTLDEIISTGKYYGATHLIPEAKRPALKPWLEGQIPGLREIHNSRGLKLYEIHYDQLPDELRNIPPLDELRGKSAMN